MVTPHSLALFICLGVKEVAHEIRVLRLHLLRYQPRTSFLLVLA